MKAPDTPVTFTRLMEHVAHAFEAVGVAVLVGGLVWSVAVAGRTWRASGGRSGYQALREMFGGVLLLGLEIFVAADLIRTVAVAPTPQNVAVLGLIVLIRTFLSFSLQVEIDGIAPWRRALIQDRPQAQSIMVRARRGPPGADH